MKKMFHLLAFLLFILLEPIIPNNDPINTKVIAVRSTENIVVDGILSESVWQREGFTGFTQQDPYTGKEPTQKSIAWFAYDDRAIYFAARYYDKQPDSIMARLVRRDYIWGDPSDGCVLYLDPFNDNRNGYFFYVSAAGTLADGLIENDVKQPNDLTWDAVWEGVPHIDSEGWTIEIRVPYTQLRFNENDSQVWGFNVERFISRSAETDMTSITPRNESGFASRFNDLVGIEHIKPSSRVEILPYVTGKAEYIGYDPMDPFNSDKKYLPGAGLDLKAGLSSSLTLDGTINPDFGQVEVDPAQVNLTDVETSFEEKRPFFTEGVTIFNFGKGGTNSNPNFGWPTINPFYSRRIGRTPQGSLPDYNYADIPSGTHILGAAKISGHIMDDWKIGTIHALTQRELAKVDVEGQRSNIEIEPLTYYGVFRMQKDFNAGQQGLGILSTFTNRFFDRKELRNNISKDALVLATDGWTFLDNDRTYVVTGWAAASRVSGDKERMIALQRSAGHYFQRPDVSYINVDSATTSMSGYAGRFMLNKNRGRWTFNTAVGFISPKFETNDLGYGSYSDLINMHFFTHYRWNEPTDYYQYTGINGAVYSSYDFGGNKTTLAYYIGSYIQFLSLYGSNFSYTYNAPSFNARKTRGGPLTLNPVSRSYDLNIYTDNRTWWYLYVEGYSKTGLDAKSQYIYSKIEFKVTPTLTLSIAPQVSSDKYEAQWITAYKDPTAKDTYGKRYVFAYLDQKTYSADIRADWIINPKLSMQIYIQPYISSGKYKNFKTLIKPKTFDFAEYGKDASTVVKNTSDNGDVSYSLDSDGDGPSPSKTIGNPDFNYISLRGNAVLRWEYMPGSALFLVWTQSRESIDSIDEFHFGKSMDNLINIKPDNIFMLKITYWFGM